MRQRRVSEVLLFPNYDPSKTLHPRMSFRSEANNAAPLRPAVNTGEELQKLLWLSDLDEPLRERRHLLAQYLLKAQRLGHFRLAR
jgi:hypothetical protein